MLWQFNLCVRGDPQLYVESEPRPKWPGQEQRCGIRPLVEGPTARPFPAEGRASIKGDCGRPPGPILRVRATFLFWRTHARTDTFTFSVGRMLQ